MNLDRRQFIILSAAAVAGCKSGGPSVTGPRLVDAGPVDAYAADGVYTKYRDEGFFIVRSGPKLVAISSICTHRGCVVSDVPDHSYKCKCHGSMFDPDGKVTHGPAKIDLPVWNAQPNEAGHLIIHVES